MYTSPRKIHYSKHQQGTTLIELMVGMTIGLLTIATAIATLGISRNVTTTVSDSTHLQQQASYAFRILGQQLRQAGARRLNLATNKAPGAPIDILDTVGIDTSFDTLNDTLKGLDSPGTGEYSLSIANQNYTEPTFPAGDETSLLRDCLGENAAGSTTIVNQFVLKDGSLMCSGTGNTPQPIIQNVSDFQVRYLVQSNTPNQYDPTIQRMTAAQVGASWWKVYGVEVCLDLVGDVPVEVPTGSTYRDCSNNSVSYGSPPRLHMVFRNVYQIRGQGLAS